MFAFITHVFVPEFTTLEDGCWLAPESSLRMALTSSKGGKIVW